MLDDQLAHGGQRTGAVQHHYSDEHTTKKPHNDVAGGERQHKVMTRGMRELASGSGIGAVNTEKPTISSQWESSWLVFD